MRYVVLLCMMFIAAGCHAPHAGPPLTEKFAGNDADAQLEFWHELGDRSMTTNDDAFHGVLLYADGKDDSADYAARVATLKSRKMLSANFNGLADEALSRGTLAVAIVRVLEIRGGLMMHLVGPTERYAIRELMYRGLYPQSSPNQTFSGSEFVGIMGRIEDYQRGDPADKPAAELPGEADASK
jgi:hypothetical protein